jgi:hypothetical protein
VLRAGLTRIGIEQDSEIALLKTKLPAPTAKSKYIISSESEDDDVFAVNGRRHTLPQPAPKKVSLCFRRRPRLTTTHFCCSKWSDEPAGSSFIGSLVLWRKRQTPLRSRQTEQERSQVEAKRQRCFPPLRVRLLPSARPGIISFAAILKIERICAGNLAARPKPDDVEAAAR